MAKTIKAAGAARRGVGFDQEVPTRSIVRVGDGRGFVIEGRDDDKVIVTAAHCLPFFPPCASISFLEERTYSELVGPLGEKPTVWAECLFVDPVGDIALLGSPDQQALPEQGEAWEALIDARPPIQLSNPPANVDVPAWLCSLSGDWFRCAVRHHNGPLFLAPSHDIVGGMSGSPILADDGSAIGVICNGDLGGRNGVTGPNPRLLGNLPGWIVEARLLEPSSGGSHDPGGHRGLA